ncbi:hypothetical protein PFISCL1PPCAC_21571, partial [Pristionchus fissidentatus]
QHDLPYVHRTHSSHHCPHPQTGRSIRLQGGSAACRIVSHRLDQILNGGQAEHGRRVQIGPSQVRMIIFT